MNSFIKTAMCLGAITWAGLVSAQKAGDDIISAGIAVMTQDISVGTLTSRGGAASTAVTGALAGASATTSGATTLSTSWLHMYTNNIGTELTLGVPPRVKLSFTIPNGASGGLSTSQPDAAEADVLTPAFVAKYFFNKPDDKLRPYLGLGVTYVMFKNIKTSAAVSTVAGGGTELDDSWTPVYNLGLIYNFDDRWSINGSVSYIPIKTDLTMVSSNPGTYGTTTGSVKFNTIDYVVRLGYKF